MVNSSYLKSIRKAKNINLSTLSADIGCTASYLSQIERGLKQPSLSVLRKLSEALNIPMVSLLAPENPEQSPPQDRSFYVSFADQRNKVILPELKTKSEVFTPINDDCAMRGTIYTTPSGCFSSEGMILHTYDECLFVLEGSADVYFENEIIYLKKGDSLYIYMPAQSITLRIAERMISCLSPSAAATPNSAATFGLR